jgi:hypothetical protein
MVEQGKLVSSHPGTSAGRRYLFTVILLMKMTDACVMWLRSDREMNIMIYMDSRTVPVLSNAFRRAKPCACQQHYQI